MYLKHHEFLHFFHANVGFLKMKYDIRFGYWDMRNKKFIYIKLYIVKKIKFSKQNYEEGATKKSLIAYFKKISMLFSAYLFWFAKLDFFFHLLMTKRERILFSCMK